eukprot:Skav234428  [mRNA]  locus=scaffold1656:170866:172110:+ [translate_table: standard]
MPMELAQNIHAQEILSKLHSFADLFAKGEKQIHRTSTCFFFLEEEGLLHARQEQVWGSGAIFVNQLFDSSHSLFVDYFRLLLQSIQRKRQAVLQVRKESLWAQARNRLDQLKAPSFGL